MSLADVCHDQVLAIVEAREARDRNLVIEGVQELVEDLDQYAQLDPMCYQAQPGDQIDALRRAAQRVIDHPDDEDDLLWLLALAEGVRRLYDDSLGEIDNWCALYLRGREDHFAGRCGECGAEDGVKRIRDRLGEMLNEMMTRKG